MSADGLDSRLRAYLDACESERALGHTNEAIRGTLTRLTDQMTAHDKSDVERFAELGSRLDQHHFRIASLETRATRVEDRADKIAEDTGNHRIVVAEKRADGPITVLLALMGAALAVVGTLLVWALTKR